MVSPLEQIDFNPQQCKSLLGIEYEQFEELVKWAEKEEKRQRSEKEKEKIRINAAGAGRKRKLSVRAGVCLCLFYLRQMPTFEVLGLHFDISKSTANNLFNYWLKILESILPPSLREQGERGSEELSEVIEELLTEYELIVDTSEQGRERPLDDEEQERYYSGKKKMHTMKNHIVVLPGGKDIVDISLGHQGPKSFITSF